MPRRRLFPAVSYPRSGHFALARPGLRFFGALLIAIGMCFVAIANAPLLAQGQADAASGAHDPGVRADPPGVHSAGGPVRGLTPHQLDYFNEGLARFNDVDDVAQGLGPRFNMDSCAGCHAQPQVGGSSPAVNPQVAVATKNGAKNIVPSFIVSNGPVREVRFVTNEDGSPDGGVHDLFTIAGRADAPDCKSNRIRQPNFDAQLALNNVIFRTPTPAFGAGLLEAIPDYAIVANRDKDDGYKRSLGIIGIENREGNAGTITRFGWKAQNKSLAIFAGEAYLVEQGVANDLFPQKRGEPGDRGTGIDDRVEPNDGCLQGSRDDSTNFDAPGTVDAMSDTMGFILFMQMLGAPQPGGQNASTQNGKALFNSVGCALCHTPSFKTGRSPIAALANQTINPYSDLLVHHMGERLQDRVTQGQATGDMFRSAPLWGLGQRIFLLHDGRTRNLVEAIEMHASAGSEANAVIARYNALGASRQQDMLNFLRSL